MNLREALKLFNVDSLSYIDSDELKKKYKRLMIKYHPDNCNGKEDKAKDIVSAHIVIMSVLKEIEKYNSIVQGSKSRTVMSIIPFEVLFDLYNNKVITVGNGEDKVDIDKNSMLKHDIKIMFDIAITVNNVTTYTNVIKNAEMLRVYDNIVVDVEVINKDPISMTVELYSIKRDIDFTFEMIKIPFKFDNNIKVNITLRKKLKQSEK